MTLSEYLMAHLWVLTYQLRNLFYSEPCLVILKVCHTLTHLTRAFPNRTLKTQYSLTMQVSNPVEKRSVTLGSDTGQFAVSFCSSVK